MSNNEEWTASIAPQRAKKCNLMWMTIEAPASLVALCQLPNEYEISSNERHNTILEEWKLVSSLSLPRSYCAAQLPNNNTLLPTSMLQRQIDRKWNDKHKKENWARVQQTKWRNDSWIIYVLFRVRTLSMARFNISVVSLALSTIGNLSASWLNWHDSSFRLRKFLSIIGPSVPCA